MFDLNGLSVKSTDAWLAPGIGPFSGALRAPSYLSAIPHPEETAAPQRPMTTRSVMPAAGRPDPASMCADAFGTIAVRVESTAPRAMRILPLAVPHPGARFTD
jgi:hypothetical protein